MQIISNEIVRMILTRIEKVTYNKRKLVANQYFHNYESTYLEVKSRKRCERWVFI